MILKPYNNPSERISNELERERREKNAIYSGHLSLCLQHKGSARTPLGPILLGPVTCCLSKLFFQVYLFITTLPLLNMSLL